MEIIVIDEQAAADYLADYAELAARYHRATHNFTRRLINKEIAELNAKQACHQAAALRKDRSRGGLW